MTSYTLPKPFHYNSLSITIEGRREAGDVYNTIIADEPVRAEPPKGAVEKYTRLMTKEPLTKEEGAFLYEECWIDVYYKGQRYGYQMAKDIWTYSARSIPELPLLHSWLYQIIGRAKPNHSCAIETIRSWNENCTKYLLGTIDTIQVLVSFKLRGHVLNIRLSNCWREDKVTYNTKTEVTDFPFYYSEIKNQVIGWAITFYKCERAIGK